jgi:phosphate starvation-inducible protein PhoH
MTQQKPTREQKPKVRQPRQQNKDHLSIHIPLKPLTESQRQMIFAFKEGSNIVAHGSAGTGKSWIACSLALSNLFEKKIEKIVIVRSAVETRSQGFLPGSLDDKSLPYTIPYRQIINQMCHNGTAYDILTKKGMLEFITTSYVRGITLENCVLIVDEFQNLDTDELYSVLTRAGKNTQIILCGDTKQCDLQRKREKSCFDWMINVSNRMPEWFDIVHFTPRDIVRSGFVKELIQVVESIG